MAVNELISSRPGSPNPRSSTSLKRYGADSVESLLTAIDQEQSSGMPPLFAAPKEVRTGPNEIDDNSRYFLKEELKSELRAEIGEWHNQISVYMQNQFTHLQSFKDDLAVRLNKSLSDQLADVQFNLLKQYRTLLTDFTTLKCTFESKEEENKRLAARVAGLEAELNELKTQKLSLSTPLLMPLDDKLNKSESNPSYLPPKVVGPNNSTVNEKRSNTVRTGPIPKFTGESENWNVWYNRFLSIGRDRDWTEADCLSEMKLLLVGTAGNYVYGELSYETRENYTLLVRALQEQFSEINLPEVRQQEFEERDQRPSESMRDYMNCLRSLYCLAWPREQGDAKRNRLVGKFLRGISNPEVSRHISVHFPDCDVAKCVEEAMRYDALQRKYQTNADVSRRVQGTEASNSAPSYSNETRKYCTNCKRNNHWTSDCRI